VTNLFSCGIVFSGNSLCDTIKLKNYAPTPTIYLLLLNKSNDRFKPLRTTLTLIRNFDT